MKFIELARLVENISRYAMISQDHFLSHISCRYLIYLSSLGK